MKSYEHPVLTMESMAHSYRINARSGTWGASEAWNSVADTLMGNAHFFRYKSGDEMPPAIKYPPVESYFAGGEA